MSQTGYSKYETGENDIPTSILIGLAKLHNTSVDYLLGKDNAPAAGQDESITLLNRAAERMTPEQRQRLIEIARVVFEDAFDD